MGQGLLRCGAKFFFEQLKDAMKEEIMEPMTINHASVCQTIAKILERQLGVSPEHALSGARFDELDSAFDSLAFVEMQVLLEDEYGVRFDEALAEHADKMPTNVLELADILLPLIAASRAVQSGA